MCPPLLEGRRGSGRPAPQHSAVQASFPVLVPLLRATYLVTLPVPIARGNVIQVGVHPTYLTLGPWLSDSHWKKGHDHPAQAQAQLAAQSKEVRSRESQWSRRELQKKSHHSQNIAPSERRAAVAHSFPSYEVRGTKTLKSAGPPPHSFIRPAASAQRQNAEQRGMESKPASVSNAAMSKPPVALEAAGTAPARSSKQDAHYHPRVGVSREVAHVLLVPVSTRQAPIIPITEDRGESSSVFLAWHRQVASQGEKTPRHASRCCTAEDMEQGGRAGLGWAGLRVDHDNSLRLLTWGLPPRGGPVIIFCEVKR
ncbi:hypothetical protein JHW43_008369 [Diplocarpon mali]|nr:hypothetical protein JHW43_008369 [Diplocarpon mali]